MRSDAMMEKLQDLMSNPNALASSLGMERVKRSNWDKEFNLEKLGFNFKVKYLDPANRLKGGVAEVAFKDLSRVMKGAPVKTLKLVINADTGDVFADGLFSFKIDYTVGFLFGGKDSGSITLERQTNFHLIDGKYMFRSNSSGNADRPPTFSLTTKTDHKSMLNFMIHFDNHKGINKFYTLTLVKIDHQTVRGEFVGDQKINFVCTLNQAESKVDVVANVDGKEYKSYIDVDLDDDNAAVKVFIDLGTAGKFDFQAYSKMMSQSHEAGISFSLNNKDIFTSKLKGVLDPHLKYDTLYEGRYSGMFGEGKVRLQYDSNTMFFKFQYLPKTGIILDLKVDMTENHYPIISFTVMENEVKYLDGNFSVGLAYTDTTVGYNALLDWQIKDKSPVYKCFYNMNCLHCLSSFKLGFNLAFDQMDAGKIQFDILTYKPDNSSYKEVHIKKSNQRVSVVLSKHFLTEMALTLNLKQKFAKGFVMDAEWLSDLSLFKVTTNIDQFENVKTITEVNNNSKVVTSSVNDKEQFKYTQSGQSGSRNIKHTLEFVNGPKYELVSTWESENYYKNKVKMSLNSLAPKKIKGDVEVEWDMTQIFQKSVAFSVQGESDSTGKFQLDRSYSYRITGASQIIEAKGSNRFPNSLLMNDLQTELICKIGNVDKSSKVTSYVTISGEKIGWEWGYVDGFKLL